MQNRLRELHSTHVHRLLERTRDLLAQRGVDVLALHSGRALKQRSVDDQFWPVKVNPSFAHYLPLVESDLILLVEQQGATLWELGQASIWEAPPSRPEGIAWDAIETNKGTKADLSKALEGRKVAFIGDDTEYARSLGLGESQVNSKDLLAELEGLRVYKSEYEIACLRLSSARAAKGHNYLAERFTSGEAVTELDLHLSFLKATEQDALDTPYSNIVALGANSAILHHVHYDRRQRSETELSLLVDAGATTHQYASDITRTYVRGTSSAAGLFGKLIEGVESIELALASEVEPGVDYESLHNRSHDLLAELLLQLEIAKGSAADIVEAGVTRAFFPHGLGHSLGLQVHDVGCRLVPPKEENPFLRNTSKIAAGQVFTIEPGCYVIEGLLEPLRGDKRRDLVAWELVEALAPFGGVRIEDNILVSESGSENLTRQEWPEKCS